MECSTNCATGHHAAFVSTDHQHLVCSVNLSRVTVVDECHPMYEGSFVCLDVLNNTLADFGFRQIKSIFVDG